jgi:predicted nucleotidyltransferase
MENMGLRKKEIIQLVRQNLSARHEIVFAYVFGSIVDSEVFKDVDVGIYLDQSISDGFHRAFEISGELEALLGCCVDVILMNTAPDHLVYSISMGEVIVNRDDDARVEFITDSWNGYFDIQPKRLMAINDIFSSSN